MSKPARQRPFTAADFERPFGLPPDKPKRSKYGNKRTTVDGITFDSQREAKRWAELKLLERGGQISGLKRQELFICEVNDVRICMYVADFTYWENHGLTRVVEDAKGVKTPVYRLKKKLVKALFGIEIRET